MKETNGNVMFYANTNQILPTSHLSCLYHFWHVHKASNIKSGILDMYISMPESISYYQCCVQTWKCAFFFFFLKLFLIERYRSAILYVNAELVNGIRLKVLFVMTLMEISDLQCLKKEVKTSYEESQRIAKSSVSEKHCMLK